MPSVATGPDRQCLEGEGVGDSEKTRAGTRVGHQKASHLTQPVACMAFNINLD